MDGFGELLLWMPFAAGALLSLFAIGAAFQLLSNHVVGGGRPLTWRLQGLVALAACVAVPVATAGYRSATWHQHVAVRIIEVGFGAALVGLVVYGLVESIRAGTFSAAETAKERLPGQGSVLQLYLLGLLFGLAGLAYIGHGFDLYAVQL